MLSVYEITKKKLKIKLLQGLKSEEPKIVAKTTMREMQENMDCRNSARMMHSAGAGNSVAGTKFCNAPFSSLFDLLSFWDLICNNEFDSRILRS